MGHYVTVCLDIYEYICKFPVLFLRVDSLPFRGRLQNQSITKFYKIQFFERNFVAQFWCEKGPSSGKVGFYIFFKKAFFVCLKKLGQIAILCTIFVWHCIFTENFYMLCPKIVTKLLCPLPYLL